MSAAVIVNSPIYGNTDKLLYKLQVEGSPYSIAMIKDATASIICLITKIVAAAWIT